jgi:hypothetical protein
MKNLTWRDLLNHLTKLPETELDSNISILVSDSSEIFPVSAIGNIEDLDDELSDVLDEGHLVLKTA